ncbi:MAG TPA: carboxypeptidase regulatory-like domain-containing protein [Candidatus Acidoferrales bacterium]|nr:carboxypeptidase regulatory-like domain-containing protein [Candidatus Acidoferrales bacterium]
MRFPRFLYCAVLILFVCSGVVAQETTGGLQGTVKDPSGASVPKAKIVISAKSLVGTKDVETDAAGYYRFANLPPDTYSVSVTANGFTGAKRDVNIDVGHLPTVDFTLEMGSTQTIVEVSGAAPQIDVTSNVTVTNVTEEVIDLIPHGRTFQSVIQFAPAARNEPLMGNTSLGGYPGNGSGGSAPGSTANGGDHGFSVAGGADSENSYLVEGQETANLIGGYSRTSVPFDFIDQVEIKNSGIQAEHGGALGGVVNVIMKKGTNNYHGSVFTYYENDAMDARPSTFYRYDPTSAQTTTPWGLTDPNFNEYVPKKDKTGDVFPGFTFGGPVIRDRIFGFVAFNPEFNSLERTVLYPSNSAVVPGGGPIAFSQNTQTYYTNARLDGAVTKRLRLYASWLYQLQRQSGENLPFWDSANGLFNISSAVAPANFSHGLGYVTPNSTTNLGADYEINSRLILTGRYGYYFENYHDFGFPQTGALTNFTASGVGLGACEAVAGVAHNLQPQNCDNPSGANYTPQFALPAAYQQPGGFFNVANSPNFTEHNANKANQVDINLAWVKSGWRGTHNFKFGYQLNHLSNAIIQHYNVPRVDFYVGNGSAYVPQGQTGTDNCAQFVALYGVCQGQFGYVSVYDFGSNGQVASNNHSFFVQDSWQIARGLTINGGLRIEKEGLPAENQPSGGISTPINFGWGNKIAPRIGVAWDPLGNGKMKIFGGYGQFYDQMKLNLAISSFGGQFWQQCYYALDTPDIASILPAFNSSGRYCVGPNGASEANFPNGTPNGLTFLENQNFRTFPTTCPTCTNTEEGVAPGLKPYKQHEYTAGIDYQIAPGLAFEARYDRRRIDHVIEDSSIFNPNIGETFVIVNPGEGVDHTFSGFYNFLAGLQPSDPNASTCTATSTPACPNILPPQRNYDGLEFRLTKTSSKHWSGMFSYTYSRLWGNYSGLTSSDQGDGGGGRNAPNNGRAFDEPFFSWDANGGSSSGLLATDRPSTFKGYGYYEFGWLRNFTSQLGIFQVLYQGSPLTSYLDAGFAFPVGFNVPNAGGGFPVDVVGRGKWVDVTQDLATGAITVGAPRTNRTPWYNQTDFNFTQSYKISESKTIGFSATVTNLLNQRSVTSVNENITSGFNSNFIAPGEHTIGAGIPFYIAAFQQYDFASLLNAAPSSSTCTAHVALPNTCGPVTVNSGYGQPNRYQAGRTIRLGVRFTF